MVTRMTDFSDMASVSSASSVPAEEATAMDLGRVSELSNAVLTEVERAVVGKREPLRLVLAGVLAGGHVLMEDFPGLGKTLAARSFAQTLGLGFKRAQFTPDLLPGDITGSFVFDQRSGDFEFRPGPIFTGLLLADEINRTPPKTQAALLEAMQEKQVTVEGRTFPLPRPFHVLATANPVEYEGTYPLPEAQLDRFLMRVSFGYPSVDEEWQILANRMARRQEEQTLDAVVTPDELLAMQAAVERVAVDESVGRYCVALAAATRTHGEVLMGASPRGALGLLLCARAHAIIDGRDFVTPEDVKAVAKPVLAHRVTVKPELWMSDVSGTSVVSRLLRSVPAPAPREQRGAGSTVPAGRPEA
ncbi:MoxR family ATPase [Intrasporangium sp. DVR]